MDFRIKNIEQRQFAGCRMKMSFSKDRTFELWNGFMKQRMRIQSGLGPDLFSIQVYPHRFFDNFNPNLEFEKWATMEVTEVVEIPGDMHLFVLSAGLYAVFIYHGLPSESAETFKYILGEWMAQSEYELDDRPHFEILGEKFKFNSPSSEEEIWIPVRSKS